MAESFDYVAFAREFEKRHGRPPTAGELEKNAAHFERVVTVHTPEETQAEIERINASYKPSLGERLKTGLSFVTRNFFKAILILLQTPVYLTLFFFNLIKSTIGVLIIWFVSKMMIALGLSLTVAYFYDDDLTKVPKFLSGLGNLLLGPNYNFLSGVGGDPNFFPNENIDVIIIIVAIIFLALVITFSKIEINA
ncbi:hypothetical protein [Streptococcus merionis]|uniref:hypothetical protein n=1 Tax=Streptococcus merionis TaxID=400065 RepID=UPI00351428CC